ncbi:SDR family oxidoreductase [Paramicrobacterium agarici]|uniref:SDR family oxidoreductase n=1 Tax=Paramicrobacterium agarici TaxID=630514 RepID=UPI00114F3DC9|nr:SDR family oxidoreductase [Microbacterium agarici]TQO22650.1 uncharacterized protein YbjT (DUF2867 family) [Microbacterium agarici]
MSAILVTGGTGTIGSYAAEGLRALGRDVRTVSRHAHTSTDGTSHIVCDLRTGDGLVDAMRDVETVLHLAGGASGDGALTATVARAARAASVAHLVLISVVGADAMPIGYFREKKAAETVVRESGVPFSILRAAQAHSLMLPLAQIMSKLPLVPNPTGLRFEPVDPRDIADRLVVIAEGTPAGLVPDLAGPQVYSLRELVQSYADAVGKRCAFVRVRIPGAIGRAYRAGENLAARDADRGERTWESYIAEHGALVVSARK